MSYFLSIMLCTVLLTHDHLLSVNDVLCGCFTCALVQSWVCVSVPAEKCLLMSWCTWEFLLPPFLLDSSFVTSVSSLFSIDFWHKIHAQMNFKQMENIRQSASHFFVTLTLSCKIQLWDRKWKIKQGLFLWAKYQTPDNLNLK